MEWEIELEAFEPLAPLLPWFVAWLLAMAIFRLILFPPLYVSIKERRLLKFVKRLLLRLLMLALRLIALLALLWVLATFGLLDPVFAALMAEIELPGTDITFPLLYPVLALLGILFLFFFVRPALGRLLPFRR